VELIIPALAPSLLWLWWFWHDAGKITQTNSMAKAFVLGALSAIAAYFLEGFGHNVFAGAETFIPFLVIGPVEELCKYVATLLALFRASPPSPAENGINAGNQHESKVLEDRPEVLTCAAAAALGFAFAENIGALFGHSALTMVARGLISVPAHVLFTVPWALAMQKRSSYGSSPLYLVWAIALSSFLHGAFDSLLFSISASPVLVLVLFAGFITILWTLYERRMGLAAHTAIGWRDLAKPLQWDRIGFIFMLGLVVSLVIAMLSQLNLPWIATDSSTSLFAGLILGLFLTGFAAPYYTADDSVTMRESAVALTLIGALSGAFFGRNIENVVYWCIALAYLGALGGWLGEALKKHPYCPLD
jgi:RsiW-degrading membrane proteinase PrsW (M82 family)